jgi:hypothetical protein
MLTMSLHQLKPLECGLREEIEEESWQTVGRRESDMMNLEACRRCSHYLRLWVPLHSKQKRLELVVWMNTMLVERQKEMPHLSVREEQISWAST